MPTQWVNLRAPEVKGLQLRKAVWTGLQEAGIRLPAGSVISLGRGGILETDSLLDLVFQCGSLKLA